MPFLPSLQTTAADCSLQYYRNPQAGLEMRRKLRSTFYRSDRYRWTPLIRTRLFRILRYFALKAIHAVIIRALQLFSVNYSLIFKMILTMTLLVLLSAFPTLAAPTGHTYEEMDMEKLIKEIERKPCAHSWEIELNTRSPISMRAHVLFSICYINTSEIPSELSHETFASSHVKITCFIIFSCI